MNDTEKMAIALRLRAIIETSASLLESLACEGRAAAMLHDASKLGDFGEEVHTTIARLAQAETPVLSFGGDDVVLGDLPGLLPAIGSGADADAQRVMGERANARADEQDEVAKWNAA